MAGRIPRVKTTTSKTLTKTPSSTITKHKTVKQTSIYDEPGTSRASSSVCGAGSTAKTPKTNISKTSVTSYDASGHKVVLEQTRISQGGGSGAVRKTTCPGSAGPYQTRTSALRAAATSRQGTCGGPPLQQIMAPPSGGRPNVSRTSLTERDSTGRLSTKSVTQKQPGKKVAGLTGFGNMNKKEGKKVFGDLLRTMEVEKQKSQVRKKTEEAERLGVAPPTADTEKKAPPQKHPPPPTRMSALHAEVSEALRQQSLADQAHVVHHAGSRVTETEVPWVETPSGRQPALQHITMERRVERSPEGETVIQHVTGINTDQSGRARQVELNVQTMDPKERLHTGALHETVSVTSSVVVTESHTQATKNILREIASTDIGVSMTPDQVGTLVAEENEDVETTMKIIPPELLESPPEKYGLKKRLQKLRLNSESMALVEQSVVYPTPTADDEQSETPPEAIATIMHSIEKGVTPKSPPNQVFKALFSENKEPEVMTVVSVAPGPLSDVVVPTEVPSQMFGEVMDAQMEKTIELVQVTEEKPKDDLYIGKKTAEPKPATTPKKKRVLPKLVEEERPPWTDEDFEPLCEMTGAIMRSNLTGLDLSSLGVDEASIQLANGIEYYLDADAIHHVSRVQLRGSQMPAWFPGYMVALPEIRDLVKISKCPTTVLNSAWKSVQPRIFPDDSIVSVDF